MEHNDYKHLKVNHSIHFKDPETEAHTNQIEGSTDLIIILYYIIL
jgi:hypothetical protein